MRRAFPVCLLLASSVLCAQQSSRANSAAAPSSPPTLVEPLFIDDGEFSSTLTLTNNALDQVSVQVEVVDDNGAEITSKQFTLPGHSNLPVRIHDLLVQTRSAAATGSVLVIPPPMDGPPIVAQLSIVSKTRETPGYIEEEILPQNDGKQPIYRASALNVKGSPILALKSFAQTSQSVTLECFPENGKPTRGTVQLNAGELLLVPACDTAKNGRTTITEQMTSDELEHRGSVGVAVTTTGSAGDLLAFGFAVHRKDDDQFFSSLNFANPTELVSSDTVFTGVPLGGTALFPGVEFRPQVAVSNFSASPAKVSVITAVTTSGNVKSDTVDLVIPAKSSKTVDLSSRDDLGITNSVIVHSSLPPGEVVSQFAAQGDSEVRTLELQAKDSGTVQNGGGHPWSIQNGATSTLLWFNHSTDGPQRFELLLGNGKQLWANTYTLGPLETKAININEMVEKQIPDKKGEVLTKDILTGQAGWWTHTLKVGTGRLMVSEPVRGLARSFSCGTCANLCGHANILPDNSATFAIAATGDLGGVAFQQCLATCGQCGGTVQGPADELPNWSSGNTSVATLDGGQGSDTATFLGIGPGSTVGNVTATDEGCTARGSGPLTVKPKVSISGPTNVPMLFAGTQGPDSIQLTATPSPSGGTFSWTATSGAGNVMILNSTSQTSTIQSVAPGTATIQVTYTLAGQSGAASQAITIQTPSQLGVTSDTGSVQNFSCGGVPYLCGVQRLIQYQVQDVNGTPVAASMPVYETFAPISNTCTDLPNTPQPSSGTTDGNGNFPGPDQLAMKSLVCLPADGNGVPQGSCDLVVNQSWFANGYRVRYQRIDYSCRTIVIAPLQ